MAIWVELIPGSEPIAGIVHEAGGRDQPFDGWLQFVAILEAALLRARGGAVDPS